MRLATYPFVLAAIEWGRKQSARSCLVSFVDRIETYPPQPKIDYALRLFKR